MGISEDLWQQEAINLSLGARSLVVAPGQGARIVSLSLDGEQMLTQPQTHPANYGSTFWDAPQSAWDWPPRAALDSLPYRSCRDGRGQALLGPVDAESGLQCYKRFAVDAERGCFVIEYRLRNSGTSSCRTAPWELTRVPGGLSFFPVSAAAGLPESALAPTLERDGVCWYRFAEGDFKVGRKLFRAGREGWLAHLLPGGLLLIKSFPEIEAGEQAPGHGSVELWGQDGGIYVELENHGRYQRLAPGESLGYRVCWFIERLPADLDVGPGSVALLEFVRGCLARRTFNPSGPA
ncbi:hypothetical protein [Niveibacterium terrae]|uniref:hypothetical protein n=1 Tax=Niveibacterium terrae TaxID=3373598 RepID=UPI003A94531A